MRPVLFTVILCSVGLVPAWHASAEPPDRLYRMVERVQDLNEAGTSWADISRMLRAEFGLVVPETSVGAVPVAAPGAQDVEMSKAYFTNDDKTHDTYAFATLRWRDCGKYRCWERDAGTNGAGDHGGPEGFALWSERQIAIHDHYLQLSDPCGKRETLKNAEFREPNGVGFRHQDTEGKASAGTTATAATVWTTASFELRAKYSHTWETTAVTSISISNTGIAFSWNDKPHHFDVVSPPNVYGRCR